MTLRLNNWQTRYPACVEMFSDGGSLPHVALGLLAGSELFSPKDSVIALAAFAGYQLSQAASGEPFERIGGELIEFALGMFLARFLPDAMAAWEKYGD